MARRINTTLKETDKFGTNKHGWTDGVSPPTDSTSGEDDWFDQAQEELASVAESLRHVIAEAEPIANRSMVLSAIRIRDTIASLNVFQPYASVINGDTFNRIAGNAIGLGGPLFYIIGNGSTVTRIFDLETNSAQDNKIAGGTPTDIFDAASGNLNWVIVGEGGKIWTQAQSPSSILTLRTTPGTDDMLRVIYRNLTGFEFFIAGGAGGVIYKSVGSNGSTWSAPTSNMTGAITGLASDGTRILATSLTGNDAISSDGVTWVGNAPTGMGTSRIADVIWNTERARWYAAADTGDSEGVYSSTDGVAWTLEHAAPSGVGYVRISVDGYGIMVVGEVGAAVTNRYIISDGRHPWTLFNTSFGGTVQSTMTVSKLTGAVFGTGSRWMTADFTNTTARLSPEMP